MKQIEIERVYFLTIGSYLIGFGTATLAPIDSTLFGLLVFLTGLIAFIFDKTIVNFSKKIINK